MSTKEDQLAKLKLHFGRRVHEQARGVVNTWSALQDVYWNDQWYNEFDASCHKLFKLASRYDYHSLTISSRAAVELLSTLTGAKAPPSDILETLNTLVNLIAEACSRVNDDLPIKQITAGKKPVYICFSDSQLSDSLQLQLNHFGIPLHSYDSFIELEKAILYRLPAAMVIDTAFENDGINLIDNIQKELTLPIPVVFYAEQTPKVESRLSVVRANGMSFFTGKLDFGLLVEQLMSIYSLRNEPPFRVLVVDDSRSQSLYAEKTLNKAGLFTRAVNNPLEVLDVIEEFRPDAILMDMYMPGCKGPEIAQVIRQQIKYDGIPILYLSAESDIDKQLEAVSQGGDDFLTKPVPKEILITTVVNRCKRYRSLRDQLIRDSLTGLIDHNNTLDELKNTINQYPTLKQPISFAMIDIDHFKAVNDTYGHGFGDRVIHSLALFLRQRFRITDTIGRYGGEEFAIVLPNTEEPTAAILLDEVRESFSKLVHHDGDKEIAITFSCGVAGFRVGEESSLLAQRADNALYQAKAAGRNQVCRAKD